MQVRNGSRPHGRFLGQPARPSKDCRFFVQTMGSTSVATRNQTQNTLGGKEFGIGRSFCGPQSTSSRVELGNKGI
jgi:hypothetical protein